jgi:hypothetical protein
MDPSSEAEVPIELFKLIEPAQDELSHFFVFPTKIGVTCS